MSNNTKGNNRFIPQGTGTQQGPQFVPEGLKDTSFKYRWCNDMGFSLQKRIQQGFSFVESEEADIISEQTGDRSLKEGSAKEGSRVVRIGGVLDTGAAYKQYLMKISKVRLAEINKELKAKADDLDKSMGKKVTIEDR